MIKNNIISVCMYSNSMLNNKFQVYMGIQSLPCNNINNNNNQPCHNNDLCSYNMNYELPLPYNEIFRVC